MCVRVYAIVVLYIFVHILRMQSLYMYMLPSLHLYIYCDVLQSNQT
jgi:hypothetical protein